MKSRIANAAAILMIGAGAVAASGSSHAQPAGPPPVIVAMPVVKKVIEQDEFVGRFEASDEVTVRARVSGYLAQVHFSDGEIVNEGDLLFTIDRRLFQTRLDQAEAQIRVAEAAFKFAEEQMGRAETLIRNGNISQSAVDERRSTFLTSQASLEQARAALEEAKIDMDYSEIRAPISGRIGRRLVTPGNLVQADDTVLTSIVAIDPIYFYFDISENYYLAYARDARVRGASLQEGGGGLHVVVTLADPEIRPREGVLDFSENRLDAATGSMRVRAVLDSADGVLTPGLFGRVTVPGSLPYEGIMIPDEAIVADQNRRLVMVVNDEGVVAPQEVRPGPKIDGYRVIRRGLEGTEKIVIEGLLRARPGMQVTPELVELPLTAEQ